MSLESQKAPSNARLELHEMLLASTVAPPMPATEAVIRTLAPQLAQEDVNKLVVPGAPLAADPAFMLATGGVWGNANCFVGPSVFVRGCVHEYGVTESGHVIHYNSYRFPESYSCSPNAWLRRSYQKLHSDQEGKAAMAFANNAWGPELITDRSAGAVWCLLGKVELYAWLSQPVDRLLPAADPPSVGLDAAIDGAILEIGCDIVQRTEMQDTACLPYWLGFCGRCGNGCNAADGTCSFCSAPVEPRNRGGYGTPIFPVPRRLATAAAHNFEIDPDRARRAYYRMFVATGPACPSDMSISTDPRGYRAIRTR